MSKSGSGDGGDDAESQPKMISWSDVRECEARGISLRWGEYYIPDSPSDDDEESALSLGFGEHCGVGSDSTVGRDNHDDECVGSEGEAVEVPEEDVTAEEERAYKNLRDPAIDPGWRLEDDLTETATNTGAPSLQGMPDILLEKIFHYAAKRPSEVCLLEIVCKRFGRMARNDELWARHPSRRLFDQGIHTCFDVTRESSLVKESISQVKSYQENSSNEILAVLGDGTGEADAFRDVAADLVSEMIYEGSGVSFRLRGDTVGYILELIQGYMVWRLEEIVLAAVHDRQEALREQTRRGLLTYPEVQEEDVAFVLPSWSSRAWNSHYLHGYSENSDPLPTCNLVSLQFYSGTLWRWPGHDCHSVLPPEAGRRIIRRLAYTAGITKMSNGAFILVEAELLHTMGVLLVDAIESSVETTRAATYLDADETLVYNGIPSDFTDMFEVPPPVLYSANGDDDEDPLEATYTIVPGQIRAAAKRRNIFPYHVFGDTWVPSSGFSADEEKEIERSYYYESPRDNSSDDEDCGRDLAGYAQNEGYEYDADFSDDSESHGSDDDLSFSDEMDWEELMPLRTEEVGPDNRHAFYARDAFGDALWRPYTQVA